MTCKSDNNIYVYILVKHSNWINYKYIVQTNPYKFMVVLSTVRFMNVKRDYSSYKLNTVVLLFITLIKNREKLSNKKNGQKHNWFNMNSNNSIVSLDIYFF